MTNYLFGLPIALSASVSPTSAFVLPIRTDQLNNSNEISRESFLEYYKPIRTNPVAELHKRLSDFSTLKENWDGYSATPPDFSVLHNSYAFLNSLPVAVVSDLGTDSLTATPYGTVVIDFNYLNDKISVEIGDKQIGFYSDFEDGTDINLESKSFNQDALPAELLKAFTKLYKATA